MDKNFNKIQEDFYHVEEFKRFYWQTQHQYIRKKELLLLSQLLAITKPKDTILEVGCGEGANIINLRSSKLNNHITGVDFSKNKIKFCKSLTIPETTFILEDARHLSFENESFDIVFIRDLLHHVDLDRDQVIKELLRVTKPNGKIIIIEANAQKITNWIFATIFKHEVGIKNSTKSKIENLLKEFSYKIKTLEPTNFFRVILHYKIGMPYLIKIPGMNTLFNFIDKICKHIIPKNNWAYWFIIISK